MKRLYLLRHGDTEFDSPTGKDHDRPLNAQGIKEIQGLASWMIEKDYMPDFIQCSSATRTCQTHETLIKSLSPDKNIKHIINPECYLASDPKLKKIIQGTDTQIDSLLIIAHNPGLAELAISMASPPYSEKIYTYPTSTMTVFDVDINHWVHFDKFLSRAIDVFTPHEQVENLYSG